jgi:hypothetical protein
MGIKWGPSPTPLSLRVYFPLFREPARGIEPNLPIHRGTISRPSRTIYSTNAYVC